MNINRLSIHAGEIHLYYADLRHYRVEKPETMLSPEELKRTERYRSDVDSQRYVKARCVLREVLSVYEKCTSGDIIFEYAKNGKPSLKGEPSGGVQFNISHSGDMVAMAISRRRRLGIDIEKMRDDIPEAELAGRFFSSTEAAAISNIRGRERSELFFKIWTRKEALLKATGEGIGGLCSNLDLLDEGDISLNGTLWQVHDLEISPGYASALAIEGDERIVKIERFLA